MQLCAVLLALLLFSGPALAQDQPGQRTIDLMWSCQGKGTWYDFAVKRGGDAEFFGQFDLLECAAYIGGMVDMNAMTRGIFGRSFFCFPEQGLVREQQVRVFLKWAEAHPELLHESRRSGVIGAFAEAFPCN